MHFNELSVISSSNSLREESRCQYGIIFRSPSNWLLLRRNVHEGVAVLNTNLLLLLPPLFQRKVCASLSALGEAQLSEAITFPPGEGRGSVGATGYHTDGQLGGTDGEGVPWNKLGPVGRFVIRCFQLNLSFPVFPELVQVLTNRW